MSDSSNSNDSKPLVIQDKTTPKTASFPSSLDNPVETLMKAFPSQKNMIQLLLDQATIQIKQVFGKKSRVAIVGPSNVGKSTLYNQLIRDKKDVAEVSPVPGTTHANQLADAGIFSIVDTPGTDAIGDQGDKEREQALLAAADADFLVIIFDAIQGIKKTELELYQSLMALEKPHIVLLNKIDLVRDKEKKVIHSAALNLHLSPEKIIPVSARSGKNLDRILIAIAVAEPEIVAALGQALPNYRWKLAWRTIVSAASISAVIALTPLPIIDFAPLIVTQSVMVLGIARIYNYEITLQRAKELVITFGIGFLGRTLFTELSKLVGLPGWLLAAAIASSTTVAMGYAAVAWFERGEKFSGDKLKQMTQNFTQFILEKLVNLGKKKNRPSIKTLEQGISEALENSPLSDNPTAIEENLQPEINHPLT